jgi:hypothetical protein
MWHQLGADPRSVLLLAENNFNTTDPELMIVGFLSLHIRSQEVGLREQS